MRGGYEEAYRVAGLETHARRLRAVDAVDAVDAPSRELPTSTAFPIDALPGPCRGLVREAAAAICCPPDFVAMPLLIELGTAIGNSRVIKLKEGWEESATVYGAVVADPGDKKTPAAKVVFEPAFKQQAELRTKHSENKERYEADLREYEKDKRECRKNGLADPVPPKPPVMERTVVEDTTVEALAGILEDTRRGVAVVRDELTAWVRSMDQYKAGGKGTDRQFWLSGWSNNYVAVDRKHRDEPLILQRPFVGVFGAIQPTVLPELGEHRDDGLLDRFLFAYPEPVTSRWTDDEISIEAREGIRRLYNDLRNLYMPKDDYGDPDPVRVAFSPGAKAVFVEVVNQHREEMETPGFPVRLKGPWSKLEAYLARLCLILAMARVVDDEAAERVEEKDVLATVALFDYFKNQARRVYVGLYGENPDDRLAEDLTKLLGELGGRFKDEPAELHRQLKSEFKPSRPDELTKKVKAIASRSPNLEIGIGNFKKDAQSRRFIELVLKNGVNGVNGVNREKDEKSGKGGAA
jgi:putative DNA primase/helicase